MAMSDSDLRTFRDFLLQYNMLTEHCFSACIKDFSTQKLGDKEEKCAKNCMDKFLKSGQRLTLRFQEHQLLNMEAQGAPIAATKAGANVIGST